MGGDALPVLTGARLRLVPACERHALACLAYTLANRAHLERWEPMAPPQCFSEAFWQARLRARVREWEEGHGFTYLLTLPGAPARVLGAVHVSNIVRGVLQAGCLAYSLDAQHQGQGLMHEALTEAIAFAFGPLCLHRLQANYQPDNARSARVLARLGFREEGLARDYLYIGGAWRDHVLTSLTNPAFDPAPFSA